MKSQFMKKTALLAVLLFVFSCSNNSIPLPPDEIEEFSNYIEIVFTTKEPNYDEVMATYYDFKNNQDVAAPLIFKYDTNGDPLPLKIIFDNYKFKSIRGEVFRNNFSEAELKVQLYIEGELVLEEKSKGTNNSFAKVIFDYDISD